MRIARLRARRYRNLSALDLEDPGRICVLFGKNAQGKTNVLEAIHVLSNLQSFRTHRSTDLVQFNESDCWISGRVEGAGVATELTVRIGPEGRLASIDGKKPTRALEYLTVFPTVVFCPQDVALAQGSRELCRRYLDRATFIAEPHHLPRIQQYRRALRQRNALLRSGAEGSEPWTAQLAAIGAEVRQARRRTLERLGPLIASLHAKISGGAEKPEITIAGDPGSREALFEALLAAEERDRRRGFTSVGPHRDWVRLRIAGRDVDEHASRGQVRSLALSMKLALLLWTAEVSGTCPVFLLDDPGSELDRARLDYLRDFLGGWQGQVWITGTAQEVVPVPSGRDVSLYSVEGGIVRAT